MELTPYELERLKKGDQRIYDKLFAHYYPVIQIYCMRLTRDLHYSQDLAVQTLFKLWLNRSTFTGEEHIRRFLFVTARNHCINHLKMVARQKKIIRELPGEEADNYSRIEAEYFDILLRKEVALLTGREHQVFELWYFEQLTVKEIAAQLGMTENNVRVHRSNALDKLGSRLFKNPDLFMLALLISIAAEKLPN